MMATRPTFLSKLTTVASGLLALILVILPFHAFLAVVAGSVAGHYEMWRVWKELVLLAMMPLTVYLAWRTPALRQKLTEGWLFWAIICYVLLHLSLGLMALHKGQVNSYALTYALVVNLRPLLMFLTAYAAAVAGHWGGGVRFAAADDLAT
jgi:hypothetical protein